MKTETTGNADGQGMQCHNCTHVHDDWSKDGEHAVNSGSHSGIITRWKCGICNSITEVGRR